MGITISNIGNTPKSFFVNAPIREITARGRKKNKNIFIILKPSLNIAIKKNTVDRKAIEGKK